MTAGPDLVVRLDGAEVARVPVEALSAAPTYEKPTAAPPWLAAQRAVDPLAFAEPADGTEALEALLGSPTIASKAWAFRQYDQQVGINTLVAQAPTRRCCASKERGEAWRLPLTAMPAMSHSIRGAERPWRWPRRPGTCPVPAVALWE